MQFLNYLQYYEPERYDSLSLDLIKESLNDEERSLVESIESITESSISSILGKIKKLFIKFIGAIKNLWNRFIDKVKAFINKIREWFNKTFRKQTQQLPNQVQASFCMEGFEPEIRSFKTVKALYDVYNNSVEAIKNEIDRVSKENLRIIKRMQDIQMRHTSVIEESSFDVIFERETFNDQTMHLPGISYDLKTNKFKSKISGYTDIVQYMYEADIFNKEDFEYIRSLQGNMEELYDALTNRTIDKLIYLLEKDSDFYLDGVNYLRNNKNGKENDSPIVNQALVHFYNYFLTCQKSKEYITRRLHASLLTYFPKNDEGYRDLLDWFNLKINQNKAIIETLYNMLNLNYKMFKLSLAEAKQIASKMKNTWELDEFALVFKENLDTFRQKDGMIYDFTELGLGAVLNSDKIADKSQHGFDTWFNLDKTKRLLKNISKYDVIIQAHEDPYNEGMGTLEEIFDELSNPEKALFMELYKDEYSLYKDMKNAEKYSNSSNDDYIKDRLKHFNKMLLSKDEYEYEQKLGTVENIAYKNIYSKYSKRISGLKFRKIIKTFNNNLWQRWKISGYIEIPGIDGKFSDVELIVYQLQKLGYKRIRVVVCNSNHFAMHDNISKFRNVITYGTDILFM